MAIEEKKSNTDAVVISAENQQETSGKPHAVEAEIFENANTEPAAEHTPITIHSEVEATGVRATFEPHNEMLSGSEIHAGSVDGSGVVLTGKEIVTELFASRAHIPGSVDNSSTWNNLEGIRRKLLNLVRGQKKAA